MDRTIIYENGAGKKVILASPALKHLFQLSGRSGFSAPNVKLIKQKYVNGTEKIVSRVIEPRIVSLNMLAVGNTEAKKDRLFFDMIDTLMDISGGETGRLYITRSDGKAVFLNCAYESGLNVTQKYKTHQKFTLEFYATDAYFYSIPYEQDIELEAGGAFTLNDNLYLGNWYLDWGTPHGVFTVTNPYNEQIDPVFEIDGTRISLKLEDAYGNTIELTNLDMKSGDRLIIDTRELYKSAYIKHSDMSVSSVLANLSWDSIDLKMPLNAGDNTISYESLGENNPLRINIMKSYLSA